MAPPASSGGGDPGSTAGCACRSCSSSPGVSLLLIPTAASRPLSFFVRERCAFMLALVYGGGAMHMPRCIQPMDQVPGNASAGSGERWERAGNGENETGRFLYFGRFLTTIV